MVFQDFDLIQERRRLERARKFKRKIKIGIISTLILLVLIGAAFACLILTKNHSAAAASSEKKKKGSSSEQESKSAPSATKADPSPPSASAINSNISVEPEKAIKVLCASTDYKNTCEKTLKDAVKENKTRSLWNPVELLQASMAKTSKELDNVTQSVFATSIKTEDPMKKAAVDDCMTLLNDARDELNSSIFATSANGGASGSEPRDEINNWLSAVISYQQTCIDGFPDGEEKNLAEKSLQITKELSSNSLAIVSEVASFLGSSDDHKRRRRILSLDNDDDEEKDKDDLSLPNWMDHLQRRALRGGAGAKLTPNSIVAKDGSGNFTTISAALGAIPQDRKGR